MESQTRSALSSQIFSDPNYDWDQAVDEVLDTDLDESQRDAITNALEMGKIDFEQPERTYSTDIQTATEREGEETTKVDDSHDDKIAPHSIDKTKITSGTPNRRKYRKLLCHPMFWGRFLTFIIALILLTLSIAYSIAGQLEVELDLLTKCDSPKNSSEIWSHSYQSGIGDDGEFTINAASQYGWTDDPCWSTQSITWDTDKLWKSNTYISKWKDPFSTNFKFIMFVIMALFLFLSSIYNIWSLVSDFNAFRRDQLHTKWHLFHKRSEEISDDSKVAWNDYTELYNRIYEMYWGLLGYDTSGYIFSSILSGFTELAVQLNAMMYYNGYNVFDPDEVQLAMKPRFIVLFSCILCTNSIATGISWLSYAWFPWRCHGLTFLLTIFIIDQFSDFFYTIFPILEITLDHYNGNGTDLWVLLGKLGEESQSTMAFISVYFPLLLLSLQLVMYTEYARWELHERWYEKWKKSKLPNNGKRSLQSLTSTIRGSKVKKNLLDTKVVKEYKNWIRDNSLLGWRKKIFLTLIFLIHLVLGIAVVIIPGKYISEAQSHCDIVSESNLFFEGDGSNVLQLNLTLSNEQKNLLSTNPELFLWRYCKYKVYPWSNEENRCQCRVFVVDLEEIASSREERETLNLTENVLLEGMLTRWTMLEKFQINGWNAEAEVFNFTESMFGAQWMKAFEWKGLQIGSLPDAISNWNHLEYLSFEDTGSLGQLPDAFGSLTTLKSLVLKGSGLSSIDESICDLVNLKLLQIFSESMESVPKCIEQLNQLQVLLVDDCIFLKEIPISIFNFPKLEMLSIVRADITYYDLLAYNLPEDIDINDSIASFDWMEDNFIWNDNTTYYLSLTSICYEVEESLSPTAEPTTPTLGPTSFAPTSSTPAPSSGISTTSSGWNYYGQYNYATTELEWDDLWSTTDSVTVSMPSNLADFLRQECEYPLSDNVIDGYHIQCMPYQLGDGKCDSPCQQHFYLEDGGDCIQSCLAEESTANCSLEKLGNWWEPYYGWPIYLWDACDEGCNNSLCMNYIGTAFNTPAVTFEWTWSWRYMAADMGSCFYDASDLYTKHPNCHGNGSVVDNYYIDPNLDEQSYSSCPVHYIADGVCDDSCMTSACGYDEGDCDESSQCAEGTICRQIYRFWNFLGDGHKWNTTYFCSDLWSVFMNKLKVELPAYGSCEYYMDQYDYNSDEHMNPRELVGLGYAALYRKFWSDTRGPQLNCSYCWGMSEYNI